MGDYIRVFASTDGGVVSNVALEYVRSLIRAAPVRLVSVTGLVHPSWRIFERLLTTDMSGKMLANVVCTEPMYWVKKIKVPMPTRNPMAEMIAARASSQFSNEERTQAPRPGSVEVAESTVELYTDGVRNVLMHGHPPLAMSGPQQRAAARYEACVFPSMWGFEKDAENIWATHVPVPVEMHSVLKQIVIGPPEKEK